jgi:adenylate cyclase
MEKAKTFFVGLFFSILLASVFSWRPVINLLEAFEFRSIDLRFLLRGEQEKPKSPIIICLIDEKSVMDYGFRSPTPRKLLAELITSLVNKKAKAIGLDILLDIETIKPHDQALERALQYSGNSVVLIEKPPGLQTLKKTAQDYGPVLLKYSQYATVGYSEIGTGPREIARWVSILPHNGQSSFVGQIYEKFYGTKLGRNLNEEQLNGLDRITLDYTREPSLLSSSHPLFPIFSPDELVNLPEEFIKGKIVLIGSGIGDLGDTFLTPFSIPSNGYQTAFGVELHGIALDMLLSRNYLNQIDSETRILIFVILFFLATIIFLATRTRYSIAALCLISLAWVIVSVAQFNTKGLVLPVFIPLAGLIVLFLVSEITKNFFTQKQSRFLKKTFKRYLSPDLVDHLLQQKKLPDMGGEEKQITTLFSDLQGFTSLSEKLDPHSLVEMLNEYLGKMTETVFDQMGTLDKYEGDAIMAIYGAPLDLKEHAVKACLTSLLMQQRMNGLNEDFNKKQLPSLKVRIGINSGSAIVGNIGSEERMDYTAIGDSVNLASRLEGVNKFFCTGIIISEDTLGLTNNQFLTRELGKIVVKGKTQPVRIFELISERSDPLFMGNGDQYKLYKQGLQAFYTREFRKASELFKKCSEEHDDQPSAFMRNQAKSMIDSTPTADWDGVIIFQQK